jgi:hypothetical protein
LLFFPRACSTIALEPSAAIQKSWLSFTGVVPNTRVAFSFEGQANQSEPWAVMDDEHTRSPYSKVFEGKLTRRWAKRIAGTKKLGWPRLCRLRDAATDTYWG